MLSWMHKVNNDYPPTLKGIPFSACKGNQATNSLHPIIVISLMKWSIKKRILLLRERSFIPQTCWERWSQDITFFFSIIEMQNWSFVFNLKQIHVNRNIFVIYFKRRKPFFLNTHIESKISVDRYWYDTRKDLIWFLFLKRCILICAHCKFFKDFSMICTEIMLLLWAVEDMYNEKIHIFWNQWPSNNYQ